MKKLLLTSIAVLFLTTGAAHAGSFFENYADKDDACLIVKKTSDSFLAVRDVPSVKSDLVAALRPGFHLIAALDQFVDGRDDILYKNWTKWIHVKGWFTNEDAEPSYGWVYRKYVQKVPCR
jgi:hypothetical protein